MDSSCFQSLAIENYILTVAIQFNWGDLSEDVVMDVGCGKEKYLCEALVRLFPSVKKVIAIDNDGVLVNELQREAGAQGKIEYHWADIENKTSLEPWLGGISKVISMNCFLPMTKQQNAFKNVYDLLIPGGEAEMIFSIDIEYHRWCPEILADPRYQQYYNCKRQMNTNLMATKLIKTNVVRLILEHTGFQVFVCVGEEKLLCYSSDATCKDSIFASFLSATYDLGSESFDVPQDMLEEFKNELFRVFLRHNPRNEDGQLWEKCTMIEVMMQKPS